MNEEWRDVVGWEGYYSVSNLGRVRRDAGWSHAQAGHILAPQARKSQKSPRLYLRVGLCRNSTTTMYSVHVLVMTVFKGACPTGFEIDHKNGDKTDNRLDNLEYVSKSENMKRSFRLGLHNMRGTRNSQTRLTAADVIEIRKLRTLGFTYKKIASLFNVCQATASNICNYKCWKDVS